MTSTTTAKCIFGFFVSGAIACQSTATMSPLHIETASAPTTTIASHHTFSFGLTETPPSGYSDSARTFEVERRAEGLIRTSLMGKGYVEAPNGELLVRVGASHGKFNSQGFERPASDWGRLEIDAYDAPTRLQVWRSTALVPIDPKEIDDPVVALAVENSLATFPLRAIEASGSPSQAANN